ncbi:MAG: hypothetical protein HY000_26630 [Planctomycetes bacterium]|nr:hypothetical protein [Planctomycetota bacterium]
MLRHPIAGVWYRARHDRALHVLWQHRMGDFSHGPSDGTSPRLTRRRLLAPGQGLYPARSSVGD